MAAWFHSVRIAIQTIMRVGGTNAHARSVDDEVLMFKPEKTTPPNIPKQIRVDLDDWKKIEQQAKKLGVHPAEIARQAISYALETMGD